MLQTLVEELEFLMSCKDYKKIYYLTNKFGSYEYI